MRGLIVWAQSVCRSQMALYRALGQELGVPIIVPVWHYMARGDCTGIRQQAGFRSDEFADVQTLPIGEDYGRGLAVLDGHRGWHHLFCVYQNSANFRRLHSEAVRRGEHTAVGSEAPCNMFLGVKKLAKEVYFRTWLPRAVREVVKGSDFFVNYSGNDDRLARLIGWPQEKIVPFGYFPPPIPGTRCMQRTGQLPLEILSTGLITWHRGCDVLVDALKVLKDRGISCHATITQDGPMRTRLEAKARHLRLPVDFVGFLPLSELNKAYETCSVYVGAGRHEPWGMRLNDALNCGAPLVVSRGMGGVKLVDDYGCGLAFENENARELALQIERLANDAKLYSMCASRTVEAAKMCSPEAKAKELGEIMRNRGWL